TGGAGNFIVDRNPSKPKSWWDKAIQGTQNFFNGVGHAIGGATKAVGQAISAGLDWLNQTVVSPVVDFVKKNATALAVAGLTLTTIGLTIANVVQVGADPATDALEVGDLGLLGEKIGQLTEEDSAASEKAAETVSKESESGNILDDISQSKLQHEFKHADDFGIDGNWNKVNGQAFKEALQKQIENVTKPIAGSYRGEQVTHYFDSITKTDVMVRPDGTLAGSWKLSQQQIENLLRNGNVQ
ncbi:MAG: hypothetical protein LBI13_04460, partial [Streptococcaceae bacterium]|nr:hypothetical protein [Streptococcaceae bacterium]